MSQREEELGKLARALDAGGKQNREEASRRILIAAEILQYGHEIGYMSVDRYTEALRREVERRFQAGANSRERAYWKCYMPESVFPKWYEKKRKDNGAKDEIVRIKNVSVQVKNGFEAMEEGYILITEERRGADRKPAIVWPDVITDAQLGLTYEAFIAIGMNPREAALAAMEVAQKDFGAAAGNSPTVEDKAKRSLTGAAPDAGDEEASRQQAY